MGLRTLAVVLLAATCGAGRGQRVAPLSATWGRVEVTAALDARPDRRALELLAPYKARVDSVTAPPLGVSRVAMAAGRPESLLGNWVADALRAGSNATGLETADMALVNVGGLRANMPDGAVRAGDVLLISPFDNRLVVLEMRGRDVLRLLRDIAAVGGEGVSHGVRMAISRDGRLLEATLNGEPVDPGRVYKVATLDYLAEGNDKMYALRRARRRHETGLLARDVLKERVIKDRVIDSRLEGRITVR